MKNKNLHLHRHLATRFIQEAYSRLNSAQTALNETKSLMSIAYCVDLKDALSTAEQHLTILVEDLKNYCIMRQMQNCALENVRYEKTATDFTALLTFAPQTYLDIFAVEKVLQTFNIKFTYDNDEKCFAVEVLSADITILQQTLAEIFDDIEIKVNFNNADTHTSADAQNDTIIFEKCALCDETQDACICADTDSTFEAMQDDIANITDCGVLVICKSFDAFEEIEQHLLKDFYADATANSNYFFAENADTVVNLQVALEKLIEKHDIRAITHIINK